MHDRYSLHSAVVRMLHDGFRVAQAVCRPSTTGVFHCATATLLIYEWYRKNFGNGCRVVDKYGTKHSLIVPQRIFPDPRSFIPILSNCRQESLHTKCGDHFWPSDSTVHYSVDFCPALSTILLRKTGSVELKRRLPR